MRNIKLKQGDLCLFNFNPSIGHEYQGKRPALVIESDKQLSKSITVTVVPLTSNLDNCLNDDIVVNKNKENKLIADSAIKVYYIMSLDYQRFINKIGQVDEMAMNVVKEYLRRHFGV